MNTQPSPIHISIYMDLVTEHGCLPAFPLLGRRIKIIATQRLPEMPSLLSLYISTFHLFHKAFTNTCFSSEESVRPAEVMSLKDLNGDQREVSSISCCIGLVTTGIIHEIIHSCIPTPSFHSTSLVECQL